MEENEIIKETDAFFSKVFGFPVKLGVDEPSVQELTISEMIGRPVRIKN